MLRAQRGHRGGTLNHAAGCVIRAVTVIENMACPMIGQRAKKRVKRLHTIGRRWYFFPQISK